MALGVYTFSVENNIYDSDPNGFYMIKNPNAKITLGIVGTAPAANNNYVWVLGNMGTPDDAGLLQTGWFSINNGGLFLTANSLLSGTVALYYTPGIKYIGFYCEPVEDTLTVNVIEYDYPGTQ